MIPNDEIPTGPEELREFLTRAQNGDDSTLPAIRKLLLRVPTAVDFFGGNLARKAEESLLNAAAGKDLAYKEAVTRKLELLRAELSGENPTAIERLLVERVVACWLQVQDADIRYAQAPNDLPITWKEFYLRRMDKANKRYLSAIKTLATVRKLAIPVLQVNIAKKQVNVATPCVVAATEKTTS
jgi:hypothetical protein